MNGVNKREKKKKKKSDTERSERKKRAQSGERTRGSEREYRQWNSMKRSTPRNNQETKYQHWALCSLRLCPLPSRNACTFGDVLFHCPFNLNASNFLTAARTGLVLIVDSISDFLLRCSRSHSKLFTLLCFAFYFGKRTPSISCLFRRLFFFCCPSSEVRCCCCCCVC